MAFGKESGNTDFPPPNYINPSTRVPVVLGLTISSCCLLLLLAGARLYARSRHRNAIGIDDWLMLGATIMGITLTGLGASSCLYGLGYHLWDRRPEWDEPYYKIGFAIQIVYPLGAGLTKMSICQTYLRIFPSSTSRLFSHSMTAFVALYTITCVVLMLSQCHPLVAYWRKDVHITCVDMRTNMLTIGAINTATDFIIYLWPARYLWRIQLPLRQRLGLVFVFTCGIVVCVAGVFRMVSLQRYFTNIDLFWDAALTTSLSVVEVNIGIVCGCLPCVKPLLIRLVPSLFRSKASSAKKSRTGNVGGQTYQFKDMSALHADKGGSTTVLHEQQIEEGIEEVESDSASVSPSTKSILEHERARDITVARDSRMLPKDVIMIDRTVTVERSWIADT